MNNSNIQIVGNVATDISFNTSGEGVPYASFRLAATDRKFDKESSRWIDGETTWYSVTCFRALAENVAACVKKGDPVVVAGRLNIRTWEKEDRSGTTADVTASIVGHDLARGTATFTRASKGISAEIGDIAA